MVNPSIGLAITAAAMLCACAAPLHPSETGMEEADVPSDPYVYETGVQSQVSSGASSNSSAAPARDPDVAIRQAFNMALAGQAPMTLEAFLARYPDHELAPTASACLAARKAGQDSQACNPVDTGK